MNRLQLTLLFIICTLTGYSQNYVDLLKVDYNYSAGNEFDGLEETSDVKELVVDATIPIPINDNLAILSGFVYENVLVTPYSGSNELSVHTVNLKMGLNKTYNDRWSATYILLPKFSSDLKAISGADFQMGAVALFKNTKSDNLNFKYGVYYNSELFGTFIVPFFGMYYQKDKWELTMLLPANVKATYSVTPLLDVGVRFNGFIKSFHLNDEFNGLDQYLTKANNEVGVFIGTNLGPVVAQVMIGRSIGRRYRTYEVGDQMGLALSAIKIGDERTQLNTDFVDGMVMKTSLVYRLDLSDR